MSKNHYEVLGLPSDPTAIHQITRDDITKAYRSRALELHPDKRPHDPDAASGFRDLKASYDVLADSAARRIFDARLVRAHQERRTRREREAAEDERMRTFRQWHEYERLKDVFLWTLMTKK